MYLEMGEKKERKRKRRRERKETILWENFFVVLSLQIYQNQQQFGKKMSLERHSREKMKEREVREMDMKQVSLSH